MSGGHFDYQQYTLREIADTIERDIARAMAPKPPKRHEDYWTIYEMTRPFSYHSLHNAFQEFDSYDKALKYLNAMEDVIKAAKEYECWRLLEEEVLFESTRRYMIDTYEGTKIPILYSIRHCVYDHYPYDLYVLELEDKTIETMKEAYRKIRIAEIYAQRVDWMMSGDDCEETLQKILPSSRKNTLLKNGIIQTLTRIKVKHFIYLPYEQRRSYISVWRWPCQNGGSRRCG